MLCPFVGLLSDTCRQIQDPRRLFIPVAAFYHNHGSRCDHRILQTLLLSYFGIVAVIGCFMACVLPFTIDQLAIVGVSGELYYLLDCLGVDGICLCGRLLSLSLIIAVSAPKNNFVLHIIFVVRIDPFEITVCHNYFKIFLSCHAH